MRALLLWLLTLSGCFPLVRDWNGDGVVRVAVLGDSNTTPYFGLSWCDVLKAKYAAVDWDCHGQGGANLIGNAAVMLTAALAGAPDVVLLAFGTNDVLARATPEQAFGALLKLSARIEAAGAVTVPALIPPFPKMGAPGRVTIAAYNAMVKEHFGARTIDFHTGMDDPELFDGVHFYPAGQKRRAVVAAAVLFGESVGADTPRVPGDAIR
jgi:lysophospholipase L1-like esterase